MTSASPLPASLAEKYQTPLQYCFHSAARYGKTSTVDRMLNKAKSVNKLNEFANWSDSDGVSALMHAAAGGRLNAMDSLIQNDALINKPDNLGRTALYYACEYLQPEAVGKLIELGASPHVMNISDGSCPLHIACALPEGAGATTKQASLSVVNYLLDGGAHLEAPDYEGETSLFWAVRENNVDVVARLVQMNADLEAKNDDGESVEPLARWLSNKKILRSLALESEPATNASPASGSGLAFATGQPLTARLTAVV